MTRDEFGQTIKTKYPQYDNLGDSEVADLVLKKYPQYQNQITEGQSAWQKVKEADASVRNALSFFDAPKDFLKGQMKTIAQQVINVGQMGDEALRQTVGRGVNLVSGKGFTAPPKADVSSIEQKLEPTNLSQKVGEASVDLGEFALGSGMASGLAKGLSLSKWVSSLSPVQQAIVKVGGRALFEAGAATGISQVQVNDIKTALTNGGISAAAPIIGSMIKTPLTKAAQKLYQSAMKPSTRLGVEETKNIIQTGLKERIWLTTGGVEKVSRRIDDFEQQLDDVISTAQSEGVHISTKGMAEYVDEAKNLFRYDVDVTASKQAMTELDDLVTNFQKEYGENVPIEIAQKLKVSTGQILRKYYGQMSGATIEGKKQMTRFLKDQIVDAAPVVGEINSRLKSLYQFDKELSRASGRIKNLNLLGLGTKIGATVGLIGGSPQAAILGALTQLIDSPLLKSGAAIGLKEVAKITEALSPEQKSSVLNSIISTFFSNKKDE